MAAPKIPKSEDDLPFRVQRKMVDWMDPVQLVRTGLRAILSATFGAYADKREAQASLGLSPFPAKIGQIGNNGSVQVTPLVQPDADFSSEEGEFWFDFTADLGDGFDSTYTIARLLAEEKLDLRNNGKAETTHRGRVLVLGGDQVYPTANREEYRDRFEGPYTAALPYVHDEARAPFLFALPGNHDWYDGLTSFVRLFCQRRWIGGWQTQQQRSYFAVKLPHGWWLWGIDIQLAADIDRHQIEFFEKIVKSDPHFKDSNVILCTGQPSWVQERRKTGGDRLKEAAGYANLGYFEKNVIVANGGSPVLTLTGDLHHYCRYHAKTEEGQRHKITAGGGGAYLYGTHSMPETLALDDSLEDSDPPVTYQRAPALFPSARESRGIAARTFLVFPWKGWRLAFMLGAIYLLNAWFVQSSSKKYGQSLLGSFITDAPHLSDLWTAIHATGAVLAHSPACLAFVLVVLAGFTFFADKGIRLAGFVHGAAHLSANLLLAWGFALLNFSLLNPNANRLAKGFSDVAESAVDSGLQTLIFSVEMLVAGSLVAGVLFGLYLTICSLIPPNFFHLNEAFSSQGIADFKNFLRLKIGPDGRLTLWPIGVRKIPRWKFRRPAAVSEPWFEPESPQPLNQMVELIEEPLSFDPPRAVGVAAHSDKHELIPSL